MVLNGVLWLAQKLASAHVSVGDSTEADCGTGRTTSSSHVHSRDKVQPGSPVTSAPSLAMECRDSQQSVAARSDDDQP